MAASAGVAITLAANNSTVPSIRRIMQYSRKGLHPKIKPLAGQQHSFPVCRWISERGLLVETGDTTLACYQVLVSKKLSELEDIIPADGSLLLILRRAARPSAELLATLAAPRVDLQAASGQHHVIAVEYGGVAGPDLQMLADQADLDVPVYIKNHAAAEYTVAFLGFQPGFPYLRGLPPALHALRRASPRVGVAAGSVAIGGPYTGIYPASGPGGWQIIGKTACELFDPHRATPALLMPGDRVSFVPL